MKKLLTIILFIIFCFSINAQTPNWAWAKSAGGHQQDIANSITKDKCGNIYVTGSYAGDSITFGSITITDTNSINGGMFVVKYNTVGNVLWVKSAGNNYLDEGKGVSTDANGNVYVTGVFMSQSITFGTYTLSNVGDEDIFLVKYDSLGNVLWAKSFAGPQRDISKSICTDKNGDVYVTGFFRSTGITFGSISLVTNGSLDMFIVKCDTSGNVLWAKSGGEALAEEGYVVSTDSNGDVYVIGTFASASITFGTTILHIDGGLDIFIVKYNSSGNVLWAKSEGGNSGDVCYGASIDVSDNLYVTGCFGSTSITFGTITLTRVAHADLFLVKYNELGGVVWAKSVGGNDLDMGAGISVDKSKNIYVTGNFNSDSITFGTTTLNKTGSIGDIFIAKFDSLGDALWAKSVGGGQFVMSKGISSEANGNVYITGYFHSSPITFGTTTLTNAGGHDMFVAMLGSNVGIAEKDDSNYKINIFPNPVSCYTTIHSDLFLKNANLIIYDTWGQAVKQITNVSGNTIILYRDNLPSGVYFIRLIENTNVIVSKRIVIAD